MPKSNESARRKKQARERAEQMRAVLLGRGVSEQQTTQVSAVPDPRISRVDEEAPDEDEFPNSDEEAAELYEWSRGLDEMNLDRATTARFSADRNSALDRLSTAARSANFRRSNTAGFQP